ncbi:magnesium transporter [Ectothiorhodospiraceae bacterium 2226]|nr:magnesium transporter [Ectothiorhodospiraceae bacterium 2226]
MEQNKPDELTVNLGALIEQDRWDEVPAALEQMHVQDIAQQLDAMDVGARLRVLRLLPRERWAPTFSYLNIGGQVELLDHLNYAEGRHVLTNLLPDDRTALLESLPPEGVERLLKWLTPADVKQALKLLGYPEQSAGRLMTPRYVAVHPDWSISRALEHIRAQSQKGETVNVIFVTDDQGKLLDAIKIKQFILTEPDAHVSDLMPGYFVSIGAWQDREEAVRLIRHYDLEALPVIDQHGVLLGLVTVDDVMDVAEQETTEDFHKIGAVGTIDLSLRDAKASLLYRKRVGWLTLLTFVNIFSGAGLAYFEATLEAVIVLVFFLPLIVASGGNAGAQAATLMVRALATGDVEARDWFRLWAKEFGVALALGATVAVVVFGLGFWRGGTDVAIVVSLAMMLVVVIGSMIGILLPFLLSRFNLDPATASAPLITSIADVVGILIYFSIATAVLL